MVGSKGKATPSPVVLVTGASGFIGQALCDQLQQAGIPFLGTSRRHSSSHQHLLAVGEVNEHTDWTKALVGVKTVIHLAGKTDSSPTDQQRDLFRVNVDGSVNLARQAAKAGAKRLIYLSSVKVFGERSDTPFTAHHPLNPEGPYARSKQAAEEALAQVARQHRLELVILRPPLIYGRGAKGNFARLLRLAGSGLPLPLAAIANQRSLLSLESLCDLIIRCLHHPAAAGQVLLAADGALSTPALIRLLAKEMDRPARLFPIPVPTLRLLGRLSGRSGEISRLVDSLLVDDSLTRRLLSWEPLFSMEQGLGRCLR